MYAKLQFETKIPTFSYKLKVGDRGEKVVFICSTFLFCPVLLLSSRDCQRL
jgi:hypothetical protein